MKKNILKRAAICGIILLFVGTNIYPASSDIKINHFDTTEEYQNIGPLTANTLYVDDNSTYPGDGTIGSPYRYIWQGIENASGGDTIFVFGGSYDNPISNDVTVNKNVYLIGETTDHPLIRGNLILTGNSITINNFTIGSITNHGISLETCNNCILTDCISQYLYMNYSNGNKVNNCELTTTTNTIGVILHNSYNNEFIGNTIHASSLVAPNYGFMLENSYNNILASNICDVSPFSFATPSACIWMKSSDNNYATNNICSASDFGIQITNSKNNTIHYNLINSNDCGIQIETSSVDNKITNNTIEENTYGILLKNTFNNQILYNNLTRNVNLSIYCSQSFKDEIHYNNIQGSNLFLLFAERSYSSATLNYWYGLGGPFLRTFRLTFGFVFVRPYKHTPLPNICP
jgi:parallel beta-helix repeat protein